MALEPSNIIQTRKTHKKKEHKHYKIYIRKKKKNLYIYLTNCATNPLLFLTAKLPLPPLNGPPGSLKVFLILIALISGCHSPVLFIYLLPNAKKNKSKQKPKKKKKKTTTQRNKNKTTNPQTRLLFQQILFLYQFLRIQHSHQQATSVMH
jgi:hypothetical protein